MEAETPLRRGTFGSIRHGDFALGEEKNGLQASSPILDTWDALLNADLAQPCPGQLCWTSAWRSGFVCRDSGGGRVHTTLVSLAGNL